MRLPWQKPDNEWVNTDRRERRNLVLTALIFSAALLVGLMLLINALVGD